MTKLSALADASLNDTDQLYINDGGASRKCTVAQLRTALASLQNVVEDTTPALGGNLDVSTFAVVDANGNELFKFTATASAVNEFTVAGGATGTGPTLSATGDDLNVDVNITPKGSGTTNFTTGGINVTGAITVSSTVDGRDVATDGTKLDTIATSATANPNALDNVSEDTTPTLGGNLDLATYGFVDASGNEQISFTSTASAVNEITVINAATGTGPIIDATGDDANIDLRLDAKGSGLIKTLKGFDVTGNITVSGTVDGRDIATDGTKLDGIATGAIANLVEDTTPQLGGQLDVNGNALGDGTLELLSFTETASAVNQVNVKNNITGSAPVISAAGDDTNIDLMLAGKGSGQVKVTATAVATQSQATTGTNNNVLMTPLRTQQQIDANEVSFSSSRILGSRAAGDTAYTALTTAQVKTLTGYITDVVNDTTPQLGGNLDVNGNSIVSVSAGNITITPDTTGSIVLDGLSWPQADGTTDQVLKTNGAGQLSWTANAGSGLANVVDDTTPQLGGQLDVNGQALGDGTLELLAFTETASAVNHVNITNAATGNGPSITAVGDDVNVSLNITPKAAGDLVLDGLKWPQADGTTDYVLKTDGAGQLSWTANTGGLSNVVEDTTPQLGGMLDVNGNALGDGTLELLTFTETVSAVNHVNITNNSTTNAPIVGAAGDDTNVDLALAGKGSGNVTIGGNRVLTTGDEGTGNGLDADTVDGVEASAFLQNVSEDTTPQLGGNLDVNGNSIVSASAGNIAITPDTTGSIVLDGLSWPQADGTANYVLKTDGAGQLSWTAQSGGLTNAQDGAGVELEVGIVDTALTNAVSTALEIFHTTSGTPASGIGVGVDFIQETAAANNEIIAQIEAVTTDVTATSEDADLVFNTMAAGAAASEGFRVKSTGGVSIPTGSTYQINGTDLATTDLSDASALSGTSAQIVVYNSGWTAASMSGDATIATSGAITLTATNTNLTTLANVTTVGTLTAGNADAIVSAASDTAAGKVELATTAEVDTGTDTARAITPAGLQASDRNIRYIIYRVLDPSTVCSGDSATAIGGELRVPFDGTILQSDTDKHRFSCYVDTAGITGTAVFDVHLNGTTIMTTNKLQIETNEKTSADAVTQPDLTTTDVTAGDILTFFCDTAQTTPSQGLTFIIPIRED